MSRRALLAILIGRVLAACGGDDGGSDAGDPAVFPDDYAATYREVRNCRFSLDHDLRYMRVLAAPDALTPYTGRTAPFPTGAIVLKEEHGENDTTCSGPIVRYTVMQKLDTGSSTGTLDWFWQDVGANRRTVPTSNVARCPACHTGCGQPPEGYAGTCTVP
jgi:cytochrome P460